MILQLKYFRFFGKNVSLKYQLSVGQTNPRTFLRKIDKVFITNLNLQSFPGQIYRVWFNCLLSELWSSIQSNNIISAYQTAKLTNSSPISKSS